MERDAEARQLLKVAGMGDDRLPLRCSRMEPCSTTDRARVGRAARGGGTAGAEHYDLVMVGGGPAGLAAAVYGASEGLRR